MKKYTKPSIELVELSVRESLSALPAGFNTKSFKMTRSAGNTGTFKDVTVYYKTSAVSSNS